MCPDTRFPTARGHLGISAELMDVGQLGSLFRPALLNVTSFRRLASLCLVPAEAGDKLWVCICHPLSQDHLQSQNHSGCMRVCACRSTCDA